MKHALFLTAAAVAALSLAACNKPATDTSKSEGAQTGNPGQTEPVNGVQDKVGSVVGAVSANTIGSHDTGAFVSNAGQGDMLEIEEAAMVLKRSKNAEVKAFAKMMASDHAALSKAMAPLIAAAGKTPPTELDQRRKGFVDNLRAAKDADFDKIYIDQQVDAHKEALDLMQGYGKDGPDAGLKDAAGKAVAKVQMHLDKARDIQAKLSASK